MVMTLIDFPRLGIVDRTKTSSELVVSLHTKFQFSTTNVAILSGQVHWH